MDIDSALVGELVAAQFPDWASLPIQRVEPGGHDNRTFRLGTDMCVRLPSHPRYALQVEKEQKWLPRLAERLPLPIPIPLVMGVPSLSFPFPWSVYRWLEGETVAGGSVGDVTQLATTLGRFIRALQQIDATDGPLPGDHNFFRGAPPAVYDTETRRAISALRGRIDGEAVAAVWDEALGSTWDRGPVWIHGDVDANNLLVRDGQLYAVIDFGGVGIGDPACDLTIAWTFFSGASREAFRDELLLDRSTWARARGWALWKALITLASSAGTGGPGADSAIRVIDDVVAEHDPPFP